MVKKGWILLLISSIMGALVLSGCTGETATPTAAVVAKKICQVTDTGGIDDKSFNATAWAGVTRAQTELGIEGKYLESQQQSDYEKNINAFIEDDCDLIITVGFLLGDATKAAAEANPDRSFAIIDFAYDPALPNVLGLVFATDQAGFLAGYTAAATTKTGKIGTFGGLNIPAVTDFMEGYALGAAHYNEVHGTAVEVLGWDPVAKDGLFVGNFESLEDGRNMAQTLLDQGADVIMPVAGPVGLGAAEKVQEVGNAWIIGVDTDWTVTDTEHAAVILTSVVKRMDNSVFAVSKDVVDGKFAPGLFVGTLANDGVGITMPQGVSAELSAELDGLKAEIVAGTLATK